MIQGDGRRDEQQPQPRHLRKPWDARCSGLPGDVKLLLLIIIVIIITRCPGTLVCMYVSIYLSIYLYI